MPKVVEEGWLLSRWWAQLNLPYKGMMRRIIIIVSLSLNCQKRRRSHSTFSTPHYKKSKKIRILILEPGTGKSSSCVRCTSVAVFSFYTCSVWIFYSPEEKIHKKYNTTWNKIPTLPNKQFFPWFKVHLKNSSCYFKWRRENEEEWRIDSDNDNESELGWGVEIIRRGSGIWWGFLPT